MADDAARWLAAFAARRRGDPPDLEAIGVEGWEPAALEAARFVWRRRAVNEALSVSLAERLHETFEGAGHPDDGTAAALRRLEEDERAHVELAGAVLARIGGEAPGDAERI